MVGGHWNWRSTWKRTVFVAAVISMMAFAGPLSCAEIATTRKIDPHPRQAGPAWDPQEETASYWNEMAQNSLTDGLRMRPNYNVAKNVIMFVGDGMGVTTVTAARILKGQRLGRPGEESVLEFERFPHVALAKTYNVDRQVPDSAATATAYLCGIKAKYLTIGVTAKTVPRNCTSSIGQEVSSILQWAQEAGKDTGFVTTTRVSHASPAALYAHTALRDWEADSLMPKEASSCKDIALQLVDDVPGRNIKVIMGGGRGYFTPKSVNDPLTGQQGLRNDGRNMIKEWIQDKQRRNMRAGYVTQTSEFDQLDVNQTDYLLGLFDYGHMAYEMDRDSSPAGQPSLARMTAKAIRMLKKSANGYFLFVEGGRIDHAHHDTYGRLALEETLAMDDAVRAAVEMTDEKDTTILVTADHSHVMTLNGAPTRGNSIFGVAGTSNVDNMTFTTLLYTNGPGYSRGYGPRRENVSGVDTSDKTYQQQVAVPLGSETHGGEDVAVYARGPMSHLFHGVQEQNYIPHALGYAACIGVNKGHCKDMYEIDVPDANDQPNGHESHGSQSSEHGGSIGGGGGGGGATGYHRTPSALAFTVTSILVLAALVQ